MRFTTAIFAAVAFATSALAQVDGFAVITSPTRDQNLQAGSTFDIIWQQGATPATADFTISLLQGATPGTLDNGAVIASVKNTGSFKWTVPSNLNFATYGIKIALTSNPATFQFSNPFHIIGSASTASSAAPSTLSTVTSSAAPSTAASSTATPKTISVPIPTTAASTSTAVNTVTATTCTKCAGAHTVNGTAPAAPTVAPTAIGGNTTSPTTPPLISTNGAMAKAATGGLAMFGAMVLAFTL